MERLACAESPLKPCDRGPEASSGNAAQEERLLLLVNEAVSGLGFRFAPLTFKGKRCLGSTVGATRDRELLESR